VAKQHTLTILLAKIKLVQWCPRWTRFQSGASSCFLWSRSSNWV